MAVRKHMIGLLVKQLLHTRTHVCLTVQCTGAAPTGGVGGAAGLWCTWATVMAHFFASSSLASSLGQGLLRCEQKYSFRISVACLLKFRLFRLQTEHQKLNVEVIYLNLLLSDKMYGNTVCILSNEGNDILMMVTVQCSLENPDPGTHVDVLSSTSTCSKLLTVLLVHFLSCDQKVCI